MGLNSFEISDGPDGYNFFYLHYNFSCVSHMCENIV